MNPVTAYNMLSEFVDLQQGDWVVQNGANSAVRRSEIAKGPVDSTNTGGTSCNRARKATRIKHNQLYSEQVRFTTLILRTLTDRCFRREDFSDVRTYLKSIGATHVIAYDDLEDKSISDRMKEWTGGKVRVDITS